MHKCIMVQGTMSGVGKSLLCAGLCRIFSDAGYRVAPFKSQNMALNSFITAEGLEIGRAQAMQAQAARTEPEAAMNPVLLKPSSDTGSQLIVMGEVKGHYSAAEYYRMKKSLIPVIQDAYAKLDRNYDIIVIEGAGSPAEINLMQDDIVNMGLARMVDAPVLLAGDIDRGGVFAQLCGTLWLLPPEDRERVKGLIINKFRGDPAILKPGLLQIEEKTGVPVFGVVPMMGLDLDDEDSLTERLQRKRTEKPVDIAVIRLPRISNFTDFEPLESHPLLGVRYVSRVSELQNPDMIIVPGTKNTMQDLIWMRENGLEASVLKKNAAGTPVLGICGGYQMLGEELCDEKHVESSLGTVHGMGLLPVKTVFSEKKTRLQRDEVTACAPFEGAKLCGYEIHMGMTENRGGTPFAVFKNGQTEGCVRGTVWGTYLHGLFDTGELTERLARFLCEKKGISCSVLGPVSREAHAQKQYDLLAEELRKTLDIGAVCRAMGLPEERIAHGI